MATQDEQRENELQRMMQEFQFEPRKKMGNISHGQAFSNFFGFFNIVLPQLDVMWHNFETKYWNQLTKPSGLECKIFPKMVEVVWPKGRNPGDLAELGRIDNVQNIIADEKLREEVIKSFTRVKSRCGAPERPYTVNLFRIYNRDKSKAFYFVGHTAPSGNVFHKAIEVMEGEDSKKYRRWYTETSQKIVDHRLNTDCKGKLLVLLVEDVEKADDEIFNALEQAESDGSPTSEPSSSEGSDIMDIKKCLIITDNDYDSIPRTRIHLTQRGIDVSSVSFGESELDENIYMNIDLILVFTADITRVEDFVAKAFAVGNQDSVLRLLVIKQGESSNNDVTLEMCPFTKEHQKLDDGLCINSDDLEKQLDDYLNRGPKHILDQVLVTDIYIGLAQAFVTNYLELQVEKLTAIAEEKRAMLKLYELVPMSGICSSERLREIVNFEEVVNVVKNGRTYVTPIYSKIIQQKKALFFMEYCTPIQVLHEMHQSPFAPLVTDEFTRREICKFIIQLQSLISASEAIKDIVTVVPLPLGEDADWEKEVTKVIEIDWQRTRSKRQ